METPFQPFAPSVPVETGLFSAFSIQLFTCDSGIFSAPSRGSEPKLCDIAHLKIIPEFTKFRSNAFGLMAQLGNLRASRHRNHPKAVSHWYSLRPKVVALHERLIVRPVRCNKGLKVHSDRVAVLEIQVDRGDSLQTRGYVFDRMTPRTAHR